MQKLSILCHQNFPAILFFSTYPRFNTRNYHFLLYKFDLPMSLLKLDEDKTNDLVNISRHMCLSP
jgi:hypothetical protein